MNTDIPGITKVTEPGGPAVAPSSPTGGGGSLVSTLPANLLDSARQRVRKQTYPNSTAERDMVDAVDRAAFERVRPVEQHLVEQGEAHVQRTRSKVQEASDLLEAMEKLNRRIRRGESTADLAQEYRTLAARAGTMLDQLSRAGREAESWRAKVADPYAHTQKVLSLMPYSSGVLIDPTPYLQR